MKVNKLIIQPDQSFEKYAYTGQIAADMGLVISAYMQQVLKTLMTKLNENGPDLDLVIRMVKDIFAMSVKSIDLSDVAFHHLYA